MEWRTTALIGLVYGGWLLLTAFWGSVPMPILFLAGGWLIAWHGSLQHEAIHGHPTGSRRLNMLLVGWPLLLYLPYARYRDSHLAHHASDLTDPTLDPESFYFSPDAWAKMPRVLRAIFWSTQTMLGRLVVGPLLAVVAFARAELREFDLRVWLPHALWTIPVIAWLVLVAEIPLATYVLCFVYPGVALTLLRSFAEHRPDGARPHRSLIVEAEWPFALLYLNNNLHAVHHDEPGLPWYELPAKYRAQKDRVLKVNGGYVMRGYREVANRFLVRPKDAPVHPDAS